MIMSGLTRNVHYNTDPLILWVTNHFLMDLRLAPQDIVGTIIIIENLWLDRSQTLSKWEPTTIILLSGHNIKLIPIDL